MGMTATTINKGHDLDAEGLHGLGHKMTQGNK